MTPAKPSLVVHYKRYASANLLGLVAGFVSFPITARLLSNAEFGVMGYWEVWVLLATALIKLGSGETLLRFYPHGQPEAEHAAYTRNFIVAPALLSLLLWCLAMAAVAWAAWAGWVEHHTVALLAMGTVLVQVVGSQFSWVLASRERSALNAGSGVLLRWLTVLVMLAVLLCCLPSAEGVFVARLVTGLAFAAWALWTLRRMLPRHLPPVDWARVREGLAYGMPMALKEASNVVLVLINRAMLKWLGGDYAAVGIYTIGFSLAMYVEHLISAALSQAINPVATRLYAEQGAPAVVALKQRVLAPLTVVCLGLVAGALVAGTDFVHLVAGHDKLASAPVFVLATVCLLLQPMMSIAGMGLLLVKRSSTVFVLTAGVALLNVALNLWLIPRHGIMGATAAVCASQLLLQAALWVACPAELRCGLPMGVLARSTALAGLVVAVGWGTNLFGLPSPLLRLGAAALLLLLLFVLPMWRLEPSLRTVARRGLAG